VYYEVRIQQKDFKRFATFKTEAKADQYIRSTNVREGLPIRNRFIVFEDRVEVELTKGKTLIYNVDNLYFVELHNWYCTLGYVVTNTSGSTTKQYFHNVVMRHNPTHITVDHCNKNRLDKHKSNLWFQQVQQC
jgi:hypothetical protein